MGHQGHLEEVGTDDDVGGVKSLGDKLVLQQEAVDNDVAMVGDEEGGFSVKVLRAGAGEVGEGRLNKELTSTIHGVGLE